MGGTTTLTEGVRNIRVSTTVLDLAGRTDADDLLHQLYHDILLPSFRREESRSP